MIDAMKAAVLKKYPNADLDGHRQKVERALSTNAMWPRWIGKGTNLAARLTVWKLPTVVVPKEAITVGSSIWTNYILVK